MDNTFSLEHKAETGDLNADLIMRQSMLDKKAKVMKINSINPKLKQSEVARELKISSCTSQRFRREKDTLSLNRIPPSSNTHTRKQKTSIHTEHDLKMVSIYVKMT